MIRHPTLRTLTRLVERDLYGSRLAKTSAHIEKCPKCGKRLHLLNNLEVAFTPRRDLSGDLTERVIAGLPKVRRVERSNLAEIRSVVGYVAVSRNGNGEGTLGFPGMVLKEGDRVRAVGDSRALIELNDGSDIYLNSDTEITLTSGLYKMAMKKGEIFAMMKPQKTGFDIRTPAALLRVVGTDFDARITEKDETILKVLRGKVSFKNESGSVEVKTRRQVRASKYSSPTPTRIKDAKSISRWTSPIKRKKRKGGGQLMKKVVTVVVSLLVIAGAILYVKKELNIGRPSVRSARNRGEQSYTARVLARSPQIRTNGVNNALRDPLILTYPGSHERIRNYVATVHKRFLQGKEIKSDIEISDDDIRTKTLCLYGTPHNHSFLERINDDLPIRIEDDGIVVGNKKCIGEDVGVIMVCPNPANRNQKVVIYGGVSDEVVVGINGIWHGPTDYVVFNDTIRSLTQRSGRMGLHSSDCFLIKGSFDKTDPQNWKVAERLQIPPPKEVLGEIVNVIVDY